jgi:hypothetical protein
MLSRPLVPLCVAMLAMSPLAAQDKPKSSSNLITAEEIERAHVNNGLEAVQLLRPRWLRVREVLTLPGSGETGNDMQMQQIHVYIDERDKGDVEFLRTIPAETIFTLRFMSTNEVGARYGPSSGPGIIVTFKH